LSSQFFPSLLLSPFLFQGIVICQIYYFFWKFFNMFELWCNLFVGFLFFSFSFVLKTDSFFFLVFLFRLESSFRNFSRPVLHAAARVVQEMGKSRAAAYAVGLQDIDEGVNVNSFSESADPVDSDFNENPYADGNFLRVKLNFFFKNKI